MQVQGCSTIPALPTTHNKTPAIQHLRWGGEVLGLPTTQFVRVALVLPMVPRKLNFACKTAVPWHRLPPLLPLHAPSAQHGRTTKHVTTTSISLNIAARMSERAWDTYRGSI